MAKPRELSGSVIEASETLSVRVEEAARMTGLCRTKVFALIASGELEAIKIGRARLIMVDTLTAFLRTRAEKRARSVGADGISR